jgi:hypothetical protein
MRTVLYKQRTFGADIRGRSFHAQKLLASFGEGLTRRLVLHRVLLPFTREVCFLTVVSPKIFLRVYYALFF